LPVSAPFWNTVPFRQFVQSADVILVAKLIVGRISEVLFLGGRSDVDGIFKGWLAYEAQTHLKNSVHSVNSTLLSELVFVELIKNCPKFRIFGFLLDINRHSHNKHCHPFE
jgi:hypothetical protein